MRADGLRRTGVLLGVLAIPALILSSHLYVMFHAQGIDVDFVGLVVLELCHWYLWAIAGPIVWQLAMRWPVTGPHRVAGIVRHAAAAFVISVLVVAVYIAINTGARQIPALHAWFQYLPRTARENALFLFTSFFHIELLVYTGIVAFANAAASRTALEERERDALRLTSALATARLQALRAQLQPHFLFNTLHTIGSLVLQRQNDRAVGMIAELGDLLRATLAGGDADLIPLCDELAHLRRYIKIEEARFGDRLDVQWDVARAPARTMVPAFILQPIVENAFKHGIARQTGEARLDIRAVADAATLRLEVYNDGAQLPPGWTLASADGVGLRNVAERLQVRDPDARLAVENTGTSGVTASISLPLRATATDASEGRREPPRSGGPSAQRPFESLRVALSRAEGRAWGRSRGPSRAK
jgi:two-component system, LytTR family, sensor kinase